ncbi:hypothetical protein X962_5018 [Burkholderia pseudomallei MSHR7343]|nr:hypothetical protein X962_5018 [Burkholderia pseudomallei MSHR7343]
MFDIAWRGRRSGLLLETIPSTTRQAARVSARRLLLNQEALAFLALDPARFAPPAAPGRSRFRVAVFRNRRTGMHLLAASPAARAEYLFRRQSVFRDARANFLQDRLEFRASRFFCLTQDLIGFGFQFEISTHVFSLYPVKHGGQYSG